jgi:hypothetical protein
VATASSDAVIEMLKNAVGVVVIQVKRYVYITYYIYNFINHFSDMIIK